METGKMTPTLCFWTNFFYAIDLFDLTVLQQAVWAPPPVMKWSNTPNEEARVSSHFR